MTYELANLDKLLNKAANLGWYGGTRTVLNIAVRGAFEGWSGRATETWEYRYFITSEEIIEQGKVIWPALSAEASTLEEAAQKALAQLNALPPL